MKVEKQPKPHGISSLKAKPTKHRCKSNPHKKNLPESPSVAICCIKQKTVAPLVITPHREQHESWMGFILRTSEVNCYRSPKMILRYAGMTENEARSVRPPLVKLAPLYARAPDSFDSMGSTSQENNKYSKRWRVLDQEVKALYLNIKTVKICPECINGNGFIDAFWDLRHALICPIHSRMAITNCPGCNKPLTWDRPGLLICGCGQNLSDERGELVEDRTILDFLFLLMCKLHGDIGDSGPQDQSGFPLADLQNMSLSTLLGIIGRHDRRGGRRTHLNIPESGLSEAHALRITAGMLAQWPEGFYDYLKNISPTNPELKAFNLQSQFHEFYSAFFKSGLPENEMAFFRKAFVAFGNERWKLNGFIDIRLASRVNESRNIVGINGLAKALNIRVPTAMNYVKRGFIQGRAVTSGTRKRMIFDLREVPFKPATGNYLKQREAAEFLGLPVPVLRHLRNKQAYKVTRLGYGISGYDEPDLVSFRNFLLEKAPSIIEFKSAKHIDIDAILRMKLGSPEVVGELLSSIIENKFSPVGRTADAIGKIVLNRPEAVRFLAAHKAKVKNGPQVSLGIEPEFIFDRPPAGNDLPARINERGYK